MAKFVAAGYKRYSEADKLRFNEALDERDMNLKRIEEDPTFVPQYTLTESFWVPESILDFSSKVKDGMDNFYCCRMRGCQYFAPNTNWLIEVKIWEELQKVSAVSGEAPPPARVWADPQKVFEIFGDTMGKLRLWPKASLEPVPPGMQVVVFVEDGAHYRCPMCFDKYEHWQNKSTRIPANKLVVTSPGGDEQLAREVDMEPNEVSFQYVLWVDTPTGILERRCQEIQLKLEQETKEMTYNQLKAHVLAKIAASSQKTYIKRMQVPAKVLSDLQWCNTNPACTERVYWRMNHLKDGFWGAHAPAFVDDATVVHDNDDAVAMWAYSRTLCNLAKKQ